MNFQGLLENVKNIESHRGYWFVRTDSGKNFETFVKNSFIGIGWNGITLEDLRDASLKAAEVKRKIAKRYNIDIDKSSGKGKTTAIYTKLLRFKEFKKGDLIIIPSSNSKLYAFGIIQDNSIYNDIDQTHNCSYYKRRKVEWLEVREVELLDPIFYKIKVSRHTISNIKRFENSIDNITDSLYRKGEYNHFVIDVKTTRDINVVSLLSYMNSSQELLNKINTHFNLNENVDSSLIRLNLQSPGKIELKLAGKAIVIFALILSLASCEDREFSQMNQEEKKEIMEFVEINHDLIDSIESVMEDLKVDKERINSIY